MQESRQLESEVTTPSPDAKSLDQLRSRIEELAAQETAKPKEADAASATSGTISVQELAREKDQQETGRLGDET